MNYLSRLELLIGSENVKTLKTKTVLIIGVGGVGSYALEAIVRSGIKKIIIIDFDKIELTNLNRQLHTNLNNIGQYKVDIWEQEIKTINPDCEIIKIKEFINSDNINLVFDNEFDYLIDACDYLETKKLIIKLCLEKKLKFISSMGTANKMDINQLKIMDLSETTYDPIAKILRKYVKDNQIKGKIPVVCSTELPLKQKSLGSNSFVPASAGLLIASHVVKELIK